MTSIAIIYHDDGIDWAQYIQEKLEKSCDEQTIQVDKIVPYQHQRVFKLRKAVRAEFDDPQRLATVIITTPGLLNYMATRSKASLNKITPQPDKTVMFLCGLEVDDIKLALNDSRRKDQMEGFDEEYCITTSEDLEDFFSQLLTIINCNKLGVIAYASEEGVPADNLPAGLPALMETDKQSQDPSSTHLSTEPPDDYQITDLPCSTKPAPAPAAREKRGLTSGFGKARMEEPSKHSVPVTRSTPRKKLNAKKAKDIKVTEMSVNPSVAKCSDDKTPVMVTFREPLDAEILDALYVTIGDKDNSLDEKTIAHEFITIHNIYTLEFSIGAHQECTVDIKVVVDIEGKDKNVISCILGSASLQYKPDIDTLVEISQLFLQILNVSLETISCDPDKVQSIDAKISEDILSIHNDDISVQAYEQLFGMYEYTAYPDSKQMFPTLLHLCAANGLYKTTMKLMSERKMSGLVACMLNKNNQTPADLARGNNHDELHEAMLKKELMDTYDLYEKMQLYGSTQQPGYYNYKKRAAASSGYMNTGKEQYDRPHVPVRVSALAAHQNLPTPGYISMKKTPENPTGEEEQYIYTVGSAPSLDLPKPAPQQPVIEIYETGEFLDNAFQTADNDPNHILKDVSDLKELRDQSDLKKFKEWKDTHAQDHMQLIKNAKQLELQASPSSARAQRSTSKKKGISGFFANIIHSKHGRQSGLDSTNRPIKTMKTKTYQRLPVIEASANRSSTSSNSSGGSRDSRNSTMSTNNDSGVDTKILEDHKPPPVPPRLIKKSSSDEDDSEEDEEDEEEEDEEEAEDENPLLDDTRAMRPLPPTPFSSCSTNPLKKTAAPRPPTKPKPAKKP